MKINNIRLNNERKRQEKLAAPKKMCYYCNTEVDPMNYGRWHGDKCKHK